MPDVSETLLPGVGVRHEFVTAITGPLAARALDSPARPATDRHL
ncbi:MAG TPA: hypothetical protein VG034_06755 [Acidimicrobiia bacterium]|jgi:hypothetical protein|nr:hypothetical protein [Acidimicrobiia bacterium]